MKKISFVITACVMMTAMFSCSKRSTPTKETTTSVPVKKIKTPVPATITVNDAVAKKMFDGRLYYDLEGHRYWKNYKDGKYYKFNKNMQGNPDFKP